MKYSLSLTGVEDPEHRAAIVAPLREYNESKAAPSGHRHLAVLLKDASGSVIGGLWGGTGYDWLTIFLLAVPPALRGHGVGREIMCLAEAEAGQRGCYGVWLNTIEFQARGFYERLGYVCFGELPHNPAGFSKFFMRKLLAAAKREV